MSKYLEYPNVLDVDDLIDYYGRNPYVPTPKRG